MYIKYLYLNATRRTIIKNSNVNKSFFIFYLKY